MNKKSQGLSLNVIIIAAIALIILVVLVAIFTGRFGLFSKGVTEAGTCENMGGKCRASCFATEDRVYGALDCGKEDKKGEPLCCKPKKESKQSPPAVLPA